MDVIMEGVFEFILEFIVEFILDKKTSKWIRIPFGIVILLVYTFLIGLWIWIGWQHLHKNGWVSVLSFGIAMLLVVGRWRK